MLKVIEDDLLPERKRLCVLGNEISKGEDKRVTYLGGKSIYEIRKLPTRDQPRQIVVLIKNCRHFEEKKESLCTLSVQNVISCCGFRPDWQICSGMNGVLTEHPRVV